MKDVESEIDHLKSFFVFVPCEVCFSMYTLNSVLISAFYSENNFT